TAGNLKTTENLTPTKNQITVKNPAVAEVSAWFNVKDFGAVGNGVKKDTEAIQKAVDACAENGGGTVAVPPGKYIIGSIFLKSNVDFYIMNGALLQASPDKEDYNAVDVCPQNSGSVRESSSGAHLFLCIEQKNVTLRGPGRIDGNGTAFTLDENGVPYPGQDKIPWRPSQMLYFVESDMIRVQDLELTNSSYWTSFYHGCTHVFIRGLKIQNSRHPHTHNGDGIDIDCCEYVSISDCHINTADDCITLRGWSTRLKNKRPCRYVTVTNCVLSTPCNCFRFGVGDGLIEHITVSNIVIENARTAFNFVSSWSATSRGTDIRNVRISNVTVDCAILAHMYMNFAEETEFRDISICGVSGNLRQVTDMDPSRRDERAKWLNVPVESMVKVVGKPTAMMKNLKFRDINLRTYPGAVWEMENVESLALENVFLRSQDPTQPIQYKLKNVKDLWQSEGNEPQI
ncbi:MAG: glycosyl hydrolase family 28 protein, partial [Planctomycetia bacterium]|nr:glycosyl hydrolase family 28 protein [Planctomycetia bacterium]